MNTAQLARLDDASPAFLEVLEGTQGLGELFVGGRHRFGSVLLQAFHVVRKQAYHVVYLQANYVASIQAYYADLTVYRQISVLTSTGEDHLLPIQQRFRNDVAIFQNHCYYHGR